MGPYQLQAAIAAFTTKRRPDETDWHADPGALWLLERMSDNPMVTLNRAIAVAMVQVPPPGSSCSTARYAMSGWPGTTGSTRSARICWRYPGDRDAAITHYRAAADRTTSIPERDYLINQAAVSPTTPTPYAPSKP